MISAIRRRLLSVTPSAHVPLDLIKVLRARTNAPIVDCKAALLSSALDLDEAHRHLRTIGLASMSKKMGRQTSHGVVAFSRDHDGAVLIELLSETDFVAKTDRFLNLATRISQLALVECRSSSNWDNPDLNSLEDRARYDLEDALVAIRESIVLKSAHGLTVDSEHKLAVYLHNRSPNRSDIGQIGVILRYLGDDDATANQIAMHIAVAAPQYLTSSDIPDDIIARERAVLQEQTEKLGKSANVTQAIVDGRVTKWKSQVTLLDQTFALGDSSTKISEMLGGVTVDGFVRKRTGEARE